MIDATQAKEIVKEFRAKEEASIMNEAMLEMEAACNLIEKKANIGFVWAQYELPEDRRIRAILHSKLEGLGFEVSHKQGDGYILIRWDLK